VNALRELEIGEPAFALQFDEDGPVYRIQLHFGGRFSHRMPSVVAFIE
jgi:hypothetical protein